MLTISVTFADDQLQEIINAFNQNSEKALTLADLESGIANDVIRETMEQDFLDRAVNGYFDESLDMIFFPENYVDLDYDELSDDELLDDIDGKPNHDKN